MQLIYIIYIYIYLYNTDIYLFENFLAEDKQMKLFRFAWYWPLQTQFKSTETIIFVSSVSCNCVKSLFNMKGIFYISRTFSSFIFKLSATAPVINKFILTR